MYSLSRWTRRARNRTGARRRPGSRRCESRRRHQKDSRARIVSDLLPSSRNHPQRSIECAGRAVIRRHAHPFAGGRARGGRGGLLRLYDLGTGWGVPPDNVAPIASVSGWPPSVGTTLADSDSVPATVIDEVRLNTRTLVPDTGTRVQLNFPTDASTPSMINGHRYGLWIHVPSPATFQLGLASVNMPSPNNGAIHPSSRRCGQVRSSMGVDRVWRTSRGRKMRHAFSTLASWSETTVPLESRPAASAHASAPSMRAMLMGT